MVALVVAPGEAEDPIDPQPFVGRIGVAARVHERINLPGDTVQITLQGLRRILIEGDANRRSRTRWPSCATASETPVEPAEVRRTDHAA